MPVYIFIRMRAGSGIEINRINVSGGRSKYELIRSLNKGRRIDGS